METTFVGWTSFHSMVVDCNVFRPQTQNKYLLLINNSIIKTSNFCLLFSSDVGM